MFETDSVSEKRGTAFHEAGHAFLHELFGLPYTDVQITEGEERVSFTYPEPTSHDDLVTQLIYACACFSGSIAEDTYSQPSNADLSGFSLIIGGGIVDNQKYRELNLPQSCRKPLLAITRKIILENWSHIEKIAESLLEKTSLTSAEVGQLLDRLDRLKLEQQRQSYHAELQSLILTLKAE